MSRKVTAKIALAIDKNGSWNASGWSMPTGAPSIEESMDLAVDGVGEGERRYWITVEVYTPEETEITAKAEPI